LLNCIPTYWSIIAAIPEQSLLLYGHWAFVDGLLVLLLYAGR